MIGTTVKNISQPATLKSNLSSYANILFLKIRVEIEQWGKRRKRWKRDNLKVADSLYKRIIIDKTVAEDWVKFVNDVK